MRYVHLYAAVTMLLLLSTQSLAQNKEIYIREFYNNKSLELLLLDLSMNYNIDFVFERKDVQGIEIKSMNIKGLDLGTAMKALLKGTDTTTIVFNFLGYETLFTRLHPETADQEMHIYMKPVDYRPDRYSSQPG